ncbi:hypothetical protein ELUMI_v1c02570 [Williamsoniiplasma luminosum]|uniref:ABC3 transporter permease C-terminal domain-containing protein n=1 Tax=Williamsoniiplasma luminosum TaxID=214888 RepID=A0A2K8NT22_9MOLU|nr:ABC transporter permease [Williamsoniiplasma luminosum]ATZ16982.1 hypothetical protein ELUMI_v1c02570 [Williamsoniiplasma luminosum]
MKLKLFFKQSLKDFITRWPLYLVFNLFFIVATSLALGLLVFSATFTKDISQTMGLDRYPNARFITQKYLVQYEGEKPLEDRYKNLFIQQEQAGLPVYNFYWDTIKEVENPGIDEKIFTGVINDLYKYFAYFEGDIYRWDPSRMITNSYLQTLPTLRHIISKGELKMINLYVSKIQSVFRSQFRVNNIQTAFILDKYVKQNPEQQDFAFQFERTWKSKVAIANVDQNFSAEILTTTPWMGDLYKGYYGDETSELLDVDKTATIPNYKLFHENYLNYTNYIQWVNLNAEQNKDYLNKASPKFGHFFYTQPKTKEDLNLKIGNIYNVTVNNKTETKSYPLLFAGTNMDASNVWHRTGSSQLYMPVQMIDKMFYETFHNEESPLTNLEQYNFYSKNFNPDQFPLKFWKENSIETGQKYFSQWFQNNMMKKVDWRPEPNLQISTYWEKHETFTNVTLTLKIFLSLAIIIVIFVLALLFLIFFFISQQIILLQQRHLFFLKSLGINNWELSLLTTLSFLVPIIIGFVLSILGSFWIKNIFMNITYENLNFYHDFFATDLVSILVSMGLILINVVAFFVINIFIINSKVLKISGMGVAKTLPKFQVHLKYTVRKLNSKTRIGLAFAFKNIYKNIVSYVILTLAFTVILFSFQFQRSMGMSIKTYENWNSPYQSIKFNRSMPVYAYALDRARTNDAFVKAYDVIDVNELKQEDALDDKFWAQDLPQKAQTLNSEMNGKYIPKKTIINIVDKIIKNPSYENDITKKMKELEDLTKTPGLSISVNMMLNKLVDIKQRIPTFDGINIVFGKIVGQKRAPTISEGKQIGIFTTNATDPKIGIGLNIVAFENDNDSKERFYYDSNFAKNTRELIGYRSNVLNRAPRPSLLVNISKHYADFAHLKPGDQFNINLEGLPAIIKRSISTRTNYDNLNSLSLKVNKIITQDTYMLSVYLPQSNLFKYLSIINSKDPTLGLLYDHTFRKMIDNNNPIYVTNSFFSQNKTPMQLEYLTFPIANYDSGTPGSSISDYFKNSHSKIIQYLNNMESDVLLFNIVTKRLETLTQPFAGIMRNTILLTTAIAVTISMIITILALLENRETILLLKTMGYKRKEVLKYLVSGYLISAFLALATSILLSWILINIASTLMIQNLDLAIPFVWNLPFILIWAGLIIGFSSLVIISIIIYTKKQLPRNALAVL